MRGWHQAGPVIKPEVITVAPGLVAATASYNKRAAVWAFSCQRTPLSCFRLALHLCFQEVVVLRVSQS